MKRMLDGDTAPWRRPAVVQRFEGGGRRGNDGGRLVRGECSPRQNFRYVVIRQLEGRVGEWLIADDGRTGLVDAEQMRFVDFPRGLPTLQAPGSFGVMSGDELNQCGSAFGIGTHVTSCGASRSEECTKLPCVDRMALIDGP